MRLVVLQRWVQLLLTSSITILSSSNSLLVGAITLPPLPAAPIFDPSDLPTYPPIVPGSKVYIVGDSCRGFDTQCAAVQASSGCPQNPPQAICIGSVHSNITTSFCPGCPLVGTAPSSSVKTSPSSSSTPVKPSRTSLPTTSTTSLRATTVPTQSSAHPQVLDVPRFPSLPVFDLTSVGTDTLAAQRFNDACARMCGGVSFRWRLESYVGCRCTNGRIPIFPGVTVINKSSLLLVDQIEEKFRQQQGLPAGGPKASAAGTVDGHDATLAVSSVGLSASSSRSAGPTSLAAISLLPVLSLCSYLLLYT